MKPKYINQEGLKDCAVACLYNIVRYYKGNIGMDKLRRLLKTDDSGTSIYNIVETSNNIGLKAVAYKCELNDICNLNLPLIAHIKIDGKYEHFVIIDKVVDNMLIIHDPIRGYITYDMDKFSSEWSNIIITFEKTDSIINEKEYGFIDNIFPYIKNNYKVIFLFLVFSIICSFVTVLNSFYLSLLYKNNKPFLIFIIFIFICILNVIIEYVRNNLIIKHNKKLDFEFTSKIYNKILSLPLKYHHNRPVGDIVSRINDLSSIKEFINVISFSLVIDLLYLIIISILIFSFSKIMFIFLLIMECMFLFIYSIFRNKIKNLSMINKENFSLTNSYLIESIIGIDTIKHFNVSNKFIENFKENYNTLLNSNEELSKTILNLELIQNFFNTFTNVLIIFIGTILYQKNLISLSILISTNTLLIYFFSSFKTFLSIDNLYVESKNSYKRLKNLILETEDDSIDNNFKFEKNINVKKLNYSYDSDIKVLNNISFKIIKGDYVFIKGKSGVGKSTIIKMLTKQLDIKDNIIKIDGYNINDLSTKDINNNICYVSQNEYIFTDSILNNIKLFKSAPKNEIEKVIKISGIDKILKDKNISIDYLLEENGHNISGGERQRILIARSLLQNKKILIFDETMNEIDVNSEREIIKKIKTEYDITFILISHRYDNSDLFNNVIEV